MDPLYYADAQGRIYEFEATTNGGAYAWFRNLATDSSVRLRVSDLRAMTDSEVLALAKAAA